MVLYWLGMEEYRFYWENLWALKESFEIQVVRHFMVRDGKTGHLSVWARKKKNPLKFRRNKCSVAHVSSTQVSSFQVMAYFMAHFPLRFFFLITKNFKDNWKTKESTNNKYHLKLFSHLHLEIIVNNLPSYFSSAMCVYVCVCVCLHI